MILNITQDVYSDPTEYMFSTINDDEKLVILRGIEAYIYVEYLFQRRDGKWHIHYKKDLAI